MNAESSDLDLMADRLRFGGSVVKAASLTLTTLGGGDESPVLFLNENGVQLLINGDFDLDSAARRSCWLQRLRQFKSEC